MKMTRYKAAGFQTGLTLLLVPIYKEDSTMKELCTENDGSTKIDGGEERGKRK